LTEPGFLGSIFPILSWFCGQNGGAGRLDSSFCAITPLVGKFWTFAAHLQNFV
jgi:hypothetical protein